MALYLFLVLAADREGRSYYRDRSIGEILRLSPSELAVTRAELIGAGLIAYRAPNWWIRGLSRPPPSPAGRPASPCHYGGPVPIRGIVPEALKQLLQSLEEKL